MHVKFAKQFAHYLILLQELESLVSEKGLVLKNQKKPPRTATDYSTASYTKKVLMKQACLIIKD